MRNRFPLLISILVLALSVSLVGCTRDRPTPEPTATGDELPAEPITSDVSDSPEEAVGEPDVVTLTPETEDAASAAAGTPEAGSEELPATFDYEVQSGDTLLSIALEFETDVETIRERNNLFSDEIQVGMPLIIPYVEGVNIPGMPTPTPGPFTYTVQAGETLGDIALKFGVEPLAIVEASNLLDQNTLSVGQELIIPNYQPSPAEVQAAGGSGDDGDDASGAVAVIHVVQNGESLGIIAEIYDADATEIARVNNVSNWNLLRVGQELIIPGITTRQAAEIRGQVHIVGSGESLSQIAAQYGVDADAIIAANEIADPNSIRVGMELIIPE